MCDEASELENIIVSRFSCSVELGTLKKYGLDLLYSSNLVKLEKLGLFLKKFFGIPF